MNQKIIFLMLPLILLVAVTPVAHATNESSYKWGYQQGKSEFANCDIFDADCNAAPDDCQSPSHVSVKNETTGYYNSIPKYNIMTNQTACMDGYSHAWEDSCVKDGKTCVALFKDYGFLPDASVVRKINGTWYRCGVERIVCGSTEPITNHIMFQNGTATNQTITWHDDARGGWFGWQ